MRIRLNPSALANTRWPEYMSRFLIGGATTALAGVVAKEFGPSIGGLFLAFPAIFPASATLIEKHEKERKHEAHEHGTRRGRKAAALDSAGASMGALGLIIFAVLVWKLIGELSPWIAVLIATLSWLAVSILVWNTRYQVKSLCPPHGH